MTKAWKFAVVAALALSVLAALSIVLAPGEVAVPRGYQCDVYTEQGCAKFVVASGGEIEVTGEVEVQSAGEIEVLSGGILDVQAGATFAPTLSGDITFVNSGTLGEAVDTVLDLSEFLAFTEQTAISVTAQAIITPTGTYQPLTSAAAVSTSLTTAIADGAVNGQILILVNENAADAITIVDGANTKMGGDKVLTGGEGDGLGVQWDGADWLCMWYNDN
jgi:hypothetical protein